MRVKARDDSLTTERLALRRFTPDDGALLWELHGDPEVMRFCGGVLTPEGSREMLQGRILEYYEEHPGLGIWATIERATGAYLGLHLLNHIRGAEHIQVGYVLSRRAWGRGYATEMCVRLLRYGFAELGLPRIVAITDLPHVASQQVLLKAGLRRAGERRFAAYGTEPLAWFERDAGGWLAEHAGGAIDGRGARAGEPDGRPRTSGPESR